MPVVSLICNMQCYYYMSFNYLSAKKLPKMCQFALQESSTAVIMGSIYWIHTGWVWLGIILWFLCGVALLGVLIETVCFLCICVRMKGCYWLQGRFYKMYRSLMYKQWDIIQGSAYTMYRSLMYIQWDIIQGCFYTMYRSLMYVQRDIKPGLTVKIVLESEVATIQDR